MDTLAAEVDRVVNAPYPTELKVSPIVYMFTTNVLMLLAAVPPWRCISNR